MAQRKSVAVSAVTNLALGASKANIPWSTYDYMDHQISFSDLGSIKATIRLYPAAAGGAQYTVMGANGYTGATVEFTGDNQSFCFPFETFGSVGFVVIFDGAFTGTVHFGSAKTAVKWLT